LTANVNTPATMLPAIEGRFPRRQRIMNVLNGPEVWEAGEVIPVPPKRNGGARRHYPRWTSVLTDTLIHEFRSASEVVAEFRDPDLWKLLQAAAKARYPNTPSEWLRDEPMPLNHYNYMKRTYLTRPDVLEALGEVHRRTAAALAPETGLCVDKPATSWTHSEPDNSIVADGKVITARTKKPRLDKSTGEHRPHCEPDIEQYVTGGGELVRGVGFVFLATRGSARNHRIILDVIDAPRAGGEAAHAMEAFRRTLPLLPGSQVVLYDGALRGTHRRELFRLGKIPVTPPRSRDNPNPREHTYGEVEVHDGGEDAIQVQLVDGLPHAKELADDGSPIYTPLERTRTTKPRGPRGACWCEYGVPEGLGGGSIWLRVTQDDQDIAEGFNREEWLHAIAPGDPDYERLYPRRNDAESGNNTLDNSLWRERAHSIGRPGIRLNCITWAFYRNAQTRALYGQRAGPTVATAA
jgi:hypothetical protein